MKLSLLAGLLLPGLLSVQLAQAVEPTPGKSKAKEKAEEAQTQSSGAIKVEKRNAVSEEDLKSGKSSTEAPTPAAPASNVEDKTISAPAATPPPDLTPEHLFGVHAALGVPHPISAGLNYVHPSRYFSAEFSVGNFGATVSDSKIKLANTEMALRYHIFAGSFYVGALYGNQTITAEKSQVIQGQTVNGKAEVKSNYLTPHFGWAWGGQTSGFYSSIEFGYQSPSSVKTEFTTDVTNPVVKADPEYAKLQKDVVDQGDKIGNMGLPHIVLFKIGWLF